MGNINESTLLADTFYTPEVSRFPRATFNLLGGKNGKVLVCAQCDHALSTSPHLAPPSYILPPPSHQLWVLIFRRRGKYPLNIEASVALLWQHYVYTLTPSVLSGAASGGFSLPKLQGSVMSGRCKLMYVM